MWDEEEDYYKKHQEEIDAQRKKVLRNPSERNLRRLLQRNKENQVTKKLREVANSKS